MTAKTLPSVALILAELEFKEGVFYRKPSGVGRYAKGGVAGTISPLGYRVIKVDGKTWAASRLAWKVMTGEDPPGEVDHRDRNRDNNCIENLRIATRAQNMQNALYRTSGSYGKSVHEYRPGKWRARINVNGKRLHLGVFDSPEEAAAAYSIAAAKYHGEFARLDTDGNVPDVPDEWSPKVAQYKGVKQIPSGKWVARIGHNKHNYYIGVFETAELARDAYNQKGRELYGEAFGTGQRW